MVKLKCIAVLRSLCPSKIHVPSQILSLFLQLHVMKSKNKNTFKVKWMKLKKSFSGQMSASWWDLLNEGLNKLTRRKLFFCDKNFFWEMSLSRKCKHYPQGSFVLLSFYEELMVIYRLSSNFAYPFLSASHFGHPPIFRK